MRGRGGLTIMAWLALAAAGPAPKVNYTYPPQARAIPELKAWMDRQAAALRASVGRAAATDADAPAPYESDRSWKVVADTPRFLSLSLDRYDYTGGAHGMSGFASLIYDRASGKRMTAADFVTSSDALRAAIRVPFCREIDAERARKRQGTPPMDANTPPEFVNCPDPLRATVIIGSSGGGRFDRLGVLVAPYAAGPYAEGAYEASFPVTPAILAAVRPEYRSYFAVGASAR